MKKIGLILTALCMASTSFAAAKATKAKIKMSDIAEILKTDSNSMMVKTHDGRKLRLQLSAAQIEEVKKNVQLASTGNTVALQAAASATAPAATTSAKAEDVAPAKSPWGFSHTIVTAANVEKIHDGEGTITQLHLPSLSYKLDNGIKLGFVPGFKWDYSLDDSKNTPNLLGWQLTAAKGGYKLPADIGLSLKGRYYIPTDKSSHKRGGLGMFRLNANFSKSITSGVSISYNAEPRYYLQSQASTFATDDFGRIEGAAKGTTGFAYNHTLGISEKINDTFSASQYVKFYHSFKHDDPELGLDSKTSNTIEIGLGLDIAAASWVSISLGIDQSHTFGDEDFEFFNTSEMTYATVFSFPIL